MAAANQHVAEHLDRQVRAQAEAGIGFPTAAQQQQLDNSLQDIREKCDSKQFLYMQSLFESGRLHHAMSGDVMKIAPTEAYAAVRVVGILGNRETTTGQKQVTEKLTGSLKVGVAADTLPKEKVYEIFNEQWKLALDPTCLPVVDALPANTFRARRYNAAIVSELGPAFQTAIAGEIRALKSLEVLQEKIDKQEKKLQEVITATNNMNKRRLTLADADDKAKRLKNKGDGKGRAMVCLKWMQGQCSKSGPCPDKQQHGGDLDKLSFLNKRFLNSRLSGEELLKLSKQQP
ncbi:unnamed protein product [Amoebophrya sp. A120]|nr:unnamed protein product [Amoebophrya sp. A120]CAD7975674.1 unnamed protein product [Amoebophrya sp. A120]CAD7975680.1 unnamed protein product [Amoebophrya sp. A120]|eukprot:GSA120T00020735001.1